MTDPLAERVRKIAARTFVLPALTRSTASWTTMPVLSPPDMLAELRDDNAHFAQHGQTHLLCDEAGDVATQACWKN